VKLGAKGGKATAAAHPRKAWRERAALAHRANLEVRQRRIDAMKRGLADAQLR